MCSSKIHSVMLVVTQPQQASSFPAEHSTGDPLFCSARSWWRVAGRGLLGETPVDAPIQWSPQAVAALVLACFCALLANSAVRRPLALWLCCVLTSQLRGQAASCEVPTFNLSRRVLSTCVCLCRASAAGAKLTLLFRRSRPSWTLGRHAPRHECLSDNDLGCTLPASAAWLDSVGPACDTDVACHMCKHIRPIHRCLDSQDSRVTPALHVMV